MWKRCVLTVVMLIWGVSNVWGQNLAGKLDPGLKMLVKAVRAGSGRPALTKATDANKPLVHLYIQGVPAGVRSAVQSAGGHIGTVVGDMSTARIQPAAIEAVAAHPAVLRMEKVPRKRPTNDRAAAHSGVPLVHLGTAPLEQAYTGEGVIVGVIDSGIDFRHLDFRDPEDPSKTRILSLWDQEDQGPGPTPENFGYGTLWSKEDLEAALAGQSTVRQQDWNGHGTHVAGTAAGNGAAVGAYKGMAPDADIIFVKGFNNEVDAASYIFEEAEKLGRPVAINYSCGVHFGPHDGTSLEAQMLDELIAASPGRVFLAAAGNEGDAFLHWGGFDLGADSLWTYYHTDIFGPYVEETADEAAPFIGVLGGINGVVFNTDATNTFVAVGMDTTEYVNQYVEPLGYHGQAPWHSLSELANREEALTDTLRYRNGELAGVVEFSAQILETGKVVFQFTILDYMSSVDLWAGESAVGADLWRFMAKGSGEIHVWSERVLSAEHRDMDLTITEDGYRPTDNRFSVGLPATARNVIAVGSYVGSVLEGQSLVEGDLVSDSSRGPTTDGRIKPDIMAPGENVTSALSGWAIPELPTATGRHHILSGTSMACPVATGSAALYLQQNPEASHVDVLAAMRSHAATDAVTTGALPNNDWGYGKLNLFAAMTGGTQPPVAGQVLAIAVGEETEGILAEANGQVAYLMVLDRPTDVDLVLSPGTGFNPVVDFFKGASFSYAVETNRVGNRVNDGGPGEPERIRRALEIGHYLIVLSSFEGTSAGDYILQAGDATGLVSVGEVLTGTLSQAGDRRHYRLVLDNPTDLVLDLISGHDLDAVVDIFRGASLLDTLASNRVGQRINASGSGGAERFEGALEAGSYLIVLSSSEGAGSFTLQVSGQGGAQALLVGRVLKDVLKQADVQKYYHIALEDTTDFILDLVPGSDLNAVVDIFKGNSPLDTLESNRVVHIDNGGNGSSEEFRRALEPGDYLVVVSAFEESSTGSYTLAVDAIGSIAQGENVPGRLVVPGWPKYHRLDLRQTTDVILETVPESSEFDMVLSLYRGASFSDVQVENRVAGPINNDGRGRMEYFQGVLESGSYLLVTSSYQGRSSGAYTVIFKTFHSIALGQTHLDSLFLIDNWDYYRMELESATNIILDLSPGSDLDAVLSLYKGASLQEENLVAEIDSSYSGDPERFEGVLEPGDYLFVVSSYRGDSAGSYALQVFSKGFPAGEGPVGSPVTASDFSGDGIVNFGDFIIFAQHFGRNAGDADFDPRMDLNEDGVVGFSDFIAFAQNFGKQVGGSKPATRKLFRL